MKPTFRPAAAELVKFLEKNADRVDPQHVERAYARLDAESKAWAIRVLAAASNDAASSALASLLMRPKELPAVHWPVLFTLERRPRAGEVLVPALAESFKNEQFSRQSAGALLGYARAGPLGVSADSIATTSAGPIRAAMAAAMGSNDNDSAAAQAEAGLYLDLIARTGSTLLEGSSQRAGG